MGRMKELYMEIREKFGDELPENFNLGEYNLQKELEYEELREIEESYNKIQKTGTDVSKDACGD
jgi:predicted nuclease with TOPRIM domain